MSLRQSFLPAFSAFVLTAFAGLHAQNLVPNGDFKATAPIDDLWDGVDADGYLCGTVRTVTALNDRFAASDVVQPISVSVGDLNGDGLPDLVTADPLGYFRVYFNSGSKTEPKFTQGEIIPVYVSRPASNGAYADLIYSTPRIDLYPITGRGTLDIVAGLYGGDFIGIANSGSESVPQFRQPSTVQSVMIPTSSRPWCIIPAPAVCDWNRDTRPDMLVGDGSYSANSIFLLQNPGTGGGFRFTDESRSYLVYGNGRAQLTPTIADYNGDGLPDVIVADRSGKVTVNLNDGKWKPGSVLEQSSVITFGGADSLRTSVTVKAADLNGDGLFDLVFGKVNGRIAVAYNKGTKEQPQFGMPEEIKGTNVWDRDIKWPTAWSCDAGAHKGNFNAILTVVSATDDPDAQIPAGQNCLKFYYKPSINKIMAFTPIKTGAANPKMGAFFLGTRPSGAGECALDAPVNTFLCQVSIPKVIPNQPYDLSFKIKGADFSASYAVGLLGLAQSAPAKIVHGERGSAAVDSGGISDSDVQEGNFGASSSWTNVSKSVTFHFKRQQALNDPEKWKGAGKIGYASSLWIRVDLTPGRGVCYIADVQLVPRQQH